MNLRILPLALSLAAAMLLAQPPSIRLVQDMHFGGLQVGGQGGMITLTYEGVRVPMGADLKPVLRPSSQEAWFQLSGPPNGKFFLRLEPERPVLAGPRGSTIQVEVAIKRVMLGLTFNTDAEKICKAALQAIGVTQKLSIVPGENLPGSGNAKPARPVSGSIQAAALNDPLVKKAQELFDAEVRSVLDLRE